MNDHYRGTSFWSGGVMLFILTFAFFFMRTSQADSDIRGHGENAVIARPSAERTSPWVTLQASRDLPSATTGAAETRQILERNLALPTALASADFNEDGVPDLVSGSIGPGGGILTLYQGNLYSIFPNHPEARRFRAEGGSTEAPFLSPGRVFDLPDAPEFLGAGDFDADGHQDVVAAAQGSSVLYWLPGDGEGHLGRARRIELSGAVTALITGEINRRDGLADVIVGIRRSDGAAVLVFEWPEGALRGEPEAIPMPAEATALTLGKLDEQAAVDLAVAAGNELLIIQGRDRKLWLGENHRADVLPAAIDQHSFPFTITSLAVGDFIREPGNRLELALLSTDGTVHVMSRAQVKRQNGWQSDILTPDSWPRATGLVCARVSGLPTDDLLVIDPTNHQLHILNSGFGDRNTQHATHSMDHVSLEADGEVTAAFPMRLNPDALSDLVLLKQRQCTPAVVLTAPVDTFTVTSTDDKGDGSLREAILAANRNPGPDLIAFDIPGMGPHTITPARMLPKITNPVTIDGTTQPDFMGAPVIELDGSMADVGQDALLFIASGSSVVRGLAINRSGDDGIELATIGGSIIEGNFIGTDMTGLVDLGNDDDGVDICGSVNNVIGGTTSSACNIISGNDDRGISIGSDSESRRSTGNVVQGNYIGTDLTGAAGLGNSNDGVELKDGATGNTIGGTASGAGNIISDNDGDGIDFQTNDITDTLVQGNFIGLDAAGATGLGNSGTGVELADGAPGNTIGGTAPGAGNIISDNGEEGITIIGGSAKRNVVQGNLIGTDVTGMVTDPDGIPDSGDELGNSGPGVFLSDASNTPIGGAMSGGGNVISGNEGNGITITGRSAARNPVQGNSIFSNSGLGIDLNDNGVTENDAGDRDRGGNGLQNFPVLATLSEDGVTVQGSLNSTRNKTFGLEFFANRECDPSGHGEGETFLSSIEVTTDGSGNADFTVNFPNEVSAGQFITAIATDPNGNSSEFSPCIEVKLAQDLIH